MYFYLSLGSLRCGSMLVEFRKLRWRIADRHAKQRVFNFWTKWHRAPNSGSCGMEMEGSDFGGLTLLNI